MTHLRHYWKLILFVAVLILPSILIVAMGLRNVALDEKNRKNDAQNSAANSRKAVRAEISNAVRLWLENIKQEIGNPGPSDPSVKFLAWADGNALAVPWETDPNAKLFAQAMEQSEFKGLRDEAEREERADRRSLSAADIYRKVIQSTWADDFQRAYARLRLARILNGSTLQSDADGLNRDLLSLPSSVVDDQGISFASTAAFELAGRAGSEALARAARDLEFPKALSLSQAYRWRTVLAKVRDSNAPLREKVQQAQDELSFQITALEQAEEEMENDPELQGLLANFPEGITEKSWQPYGRDLLVSRIPADAAGRRRIIAVSRTSVFDAVRKARQTRPTYTILVDGDSGESLDELYLPGIKIDFGPVEKFETAGLVGGHSFYLPLVLLVVSLNLFGGYLLWRDTQREARLTELRSQFVSSVSHELKTPLTSIRMFAEILQTRESVDPETHSECLDTIVNESERLTRLLNNVLDFSRIEHGQKTYCMESTQLSEVMKAAVKTMQYPLAEQGFDLLVDIKEGIPPVDADRDALKQAVLNLLTNAMKYSGQSRGIELRLVSQNGDALIQVADHGIGIATREQSRIFERFYRAQVPENNSVSGTGLGLALVMHIVAAHGGIVEVESIVGAGSTFSIRLPIHKGVLA